jgi:hypothetical protein
MIKRYFWLAILLAFALAVACGTTSNGSDGGDKCGSDTLCTQCGADPWCYHDELVTQRDHSRCGNITVYWGSGADGVEGSCYMEIAIATNDCSLCAKITKSDIRSTCNQDCN